MRPGIYELINEIVDDSQYNKTLDPQSQQTGVLTNSQIKRRSIVNARLVGLIFTYYWLLFFEGPLRKWGLPQFEEIIVIIRFPVILVLCGYALHLQWLIEHPEQWPAMTDAGRKHSEVEFNARLQR